MGIYICIYIYEEFGDGFLSYSEWDWEREPPGFCPR